MIYVFSLRFIVCKMSFNAELADGFPLEEAAEQQVRCIIFPFRNCDIFIFFLFSG